MSTGGAVASARRIFDLAYDRTSGDLQGSVE
jgi:hypothetical protein